MADNFAVYTALVAAQQENCGNLNALIDNREMGLAHECIIENNCTVNCTTLVDVDPRDANPTNTAIYRVTFDPCEKTVHYESIEVTTQTRTVLVDNTTSENLSQVFDRDKTVNLMVLPTDDGVIFGVSKIHCSISVMQ